MAEIHGIRHVEGFRQGVQILPFRPVADDTAGYRHAIGVEQGHRFEQQVDALM
jgi:hypothetical protein